MLRHASSMIKRQVQHLSMVKILTWTRRSAEMNTIQTLMMQLLTRQLKLKASIVAREERLQMKVKEINLSVSFLNSSRMLLLNLLMLLRIYQLPDTKTLSWANSTKIEFWLFLETQAVVKLLKSLSTYLSKELVENKKLTLYARSLVVLLA